MRYCYQKAYNFLLLKLSDFSLTSLFWTAGMFVIINTQIIFHIRLVGMFTICTPNFPRFLSYHHKKETWIRISRRHVIILHSTANITLTKADGWELSWDSTRASPNHYWAKFGKRTMRRFQMNDVKVIRTLSHQSTVENTCELNA